jgi:hypothetical protein
MPATSASLWRTFSPGPQDWPLAVCDGRTVRDEETASNTLFVVDEFPTGDALTAPVEGEEDMIAATIFRYRPRHRWWYFSTWQPMTCCCSVPGQRPFRDLALPAHRLPRYQPARCQDPLQHRGALRGLF